MSQQGTFTVNKSNYWVTLREASPADQGKLLSLLLSTGEVAPAPQCPGLGLAVQGGCVGGPVKNYPIKMVRHPVNTAY